MGNIPRAFKDWNVLIVDDEYDSLEVLRRLLVLAGANVKTAMNGRLALEYLEEKSPDFIITDLSMPELNGYEMLKIIQDNELHIPVIALTAHAMTGDREKVMAAGFDGYISKPLLPERLIYQLMGDLASVPELETHFTVRMS